MVLKEFNKGSAGGEGKVRLNLKTSKAGGFYCTRAVPKVDDAGNVIIENGRKVFEDKYALKYNPATMKLLEKAEDGTLSEIEVRKDLEIKFEVVGLIVRDAVGTDWAEWRKANPNGSNKGKGKAKADAKPASNAPAEEKAEGDGTTPYDP